MILYCNLLICLCNICIHSYIVANFRGFYILQMVIQSVFSKIEFQNKVFLKSVTADFFIVFQLKFTM